jgi:hypothetical protein
MQKELSFQKRAFVQAYLQTWNAAAAAREAKYRGDSDKVGWRLLHLPDIQAAILEAMKKDGMPPEEVIDRLTQQGRVNPSTFLTFEDQPVRDDDGQPVKNDIGEPLTRRVMTGINWGMVERYGYLIKKISYTRQGVPVLEFHDPQKALELIGKAQQIFVDRTDPNVNVVNVTVKVIKGVSVDDL